MTTERAAETPGALLTQVSAQRFGPLTRLRKAVADRMVTARNRQAERTLRADRELWSLMTDYAAATAVTGAAFSDYLTLYEQVRRYRPVEILECGTGISTVVLAQALRANEADGAPRAALAPEQRSRCRSHTQGSPPADTDALAHRA